MEYCKHGKHECEFCLHCYTAKHREPSVTWRNLVNEFKGAKAVNVGFAENEVSVAYHETVVFRYYLDDGLVEFCADGHKGKYTKDRINRALQCVGVPMRVISKSKEWFVDCFETGEVVAFEDGLGLGPAYYRKGI